MKKNVCVVTGSRAEYGIMKSLIQKLVDDQEITLDIIVTAMHLEEKYGNTYQKIENDGFEIYKKIPLNLVDTSKETIIKAVATLSIELSKLFNEKKYDLLILLGDRYEMLAVANTALIYNIPMCHLHGGEKTLGNFDESIRHAITKMAHLHLTVTDDYYKRVIQLGEYPNSVFNVGSLGVENVMRSELISVKKLNDKLKITLSSKYYVVLFHPVTLEGEKEALEQISILLSALDEIDGQFIFIGSNSDTGSDYIMEKIMGFINIHKNSFLFKSLDTLAYHSLISHSKGLIGNSSSGIIEVPSLKVPTLNIGNRQKGRIHGKSVIDVPNTKQDIVKGVECLKEVTDYTNPYEKENATENSYKIIKNAINCGIPLQKNFFDVKEIGVGKE